MCVSVVPQPSPDVSRTVRRVRSSRRLHSWLGIGLAVLVLVSAVTGVLLGWKKQVNWLQPPTAKGTAGELEDWRTLGDLRSIAQEAFRQNAPPGSPDAVDRMDVRPGKNSVKVLFEFDDYEIQLDGVSGEVLSVAQRNADWIERIHDGSIVSEAFKVLSMNVLGVGLAVMVVTGAWLYFGPRRIRARRRAN